MEMESKNQNIFIDDVVMSFYLSLKTKKDLERSNPCWQRKNNSVIDIINALEKAWDKV